MKIDDSPPYSIILQQYRELSSAVFDAAKEAKEQKLIGLLALKGMLDGVYKIIENHAVQKGRGLALMVFSEVSGQGAWKVTQRLAAQSAQLLALDARSAGGVSSSSGGRSFPRRSGPNRNPQAARGNGRVDLSKIKCHECAQYGHMRSGCPLLKNKTA